MQPRQNERYLRQIQVREFGQSGQNAVRNATFLVIGAGGLGCPALQTLAASGAGTVIIVDSDTVEASNLSRQFLHSESKIGQNKALSAAAALCAINPDIKAVPIPERVDDTNLPALVKSADVVLDCCDNSSTRHAVNRACFKGRKPLVTAGCIRASGQISVFDFRMKDSPCYACNFPEDDTPDIKASDQGVMTFLTSTLGNLQAAEALKLAAGMASGLTGKVLLMDLLRDDFHIIALPRNPECQVCSRKPA